MSFYVDIPVMPPDSDDDTWVNVAVLSTKREAIELLAHMWGIAEAHADAFIIEGDAELRPFGVKEDDNEQA